MGYGTNKNTESGDTREGIRPFHDFECWTMYLEWCKSEGFHVCEYDDIYGFTMCDTTTGELKFVAHVDPTGEPVPTGCTPEFEDGSEW